MRTRRECYSRKYAAGDCAIIRPKRSPTDDFKSFKVYFYLIFTAERLITINYYMSCSLNVTYIKYEINLTLLYLINQT